MAEQNYLLNQHPSDENFHAEGLPVHSEYSAYIPRWNYLMRSYLGGVQYKLGKYLTRYVYETEGEFTARLRQTPLDNHVKSIIHIYNSFLFRNEPKRELGNLKGMAEVENFLEDADMEGRSWQSFMRDVNIMSSVYGHCVVLVDRPETAVGTRAEELEQGIRPYATLYTPENVIDWHWTRLPSGHYELQYVKFLETDSRTHNEADSYHVRTWTKDEIYLESFDAKSNKPMTMIDRKPNPIGVIPAVWCYAARSPIRGIGVSDVGDIADNQNFLFSLYSEAEQLIRLTNHPTLVKDRETEATAGAGAVITMSDTVTAETRPFLLQPNGSNLDAILKTIDQTIKSIDRMAHMGAIRAIETRQMSGVSQQAEFQLLDAKLCEKAKNLELAEEQIWRLFSRWQGQAWTGSVKYPMAFHIRDKNLDMDILKKVAETAALITKSDNTMTREIINQKIKELLAKDEDELDAMNQQQPMDTLTHAPMTDQNDMVAHMRSMIEEGMTDEQIKQLHPEIAKFFSNEQETPQE